MGARSLNRIILIGNLTRDPELKYTPNGTAVCTFGIATNRSWATTSGEIKEDTQFHRVVCWQKLAELTSKLLSKGRKVYLEGRITYRSFMGKDGTQKNITEIVMSDFILFDDRYKSQMTDASSDIKPPADIEKIDDLDDFADEEEVGESKDKKTDSSKSDAKKETAKKASKEKSKNAEDDKSEDIDPSDIPF